MNDEIHFYELQEWLTESLKHHHIIRYSQVVNLKIRDLISSGVPVGTVIHLCEHLEKKGMYPLDGKNSLTRLHLCKENFLKLYENGVEDLTDLELYTYRELIDDLGFSTHMAKYIESRMNWLGKPLS